MRHDVGQIQKSEEFVRRANVRGHDPKSAPVLSKDARLYVNPFADVDPKRLRWELQADRGVLVGNPLKSLERTS